MIKNFFDDALTNSWTSNGIPENIFDTNCNWPYSVIDFDKISYDSGYVRADFYQKDRWHLNELGHDLLSNEIDLKLIDLYSIS